jgi:hypothetical protein
MSNDSTSEPNSKVMSDKSNANCRNFCKKLCTKQVTVLLLVDVTAY